MSDEVWTLWDKPPASLDIDSEKSPQLTVHLAAIPNGCGVIVCPGGGYRTLASDHEGRQVAQWLNLVGIHAFVLRYRLGPRYHSSMSKLDGQRAIRLVRFHAAALGLDPTRLGMLGFSAGGHLALATALASDELGSSSVADEIDRQGCRPNFLVPVYAVTNGAKRGRKADEYLPMDTQVSSNSPPTFIVHNHQDSVVPASQSTLLYDALLAANVPAELHIFNFGDHGLGLNRGSGAKDPALTIWGELLLQWLARHEFLLDKVKHSERTAVEGEILLDGKPVGMGWLSWIPDDANLPIARVRLTAAHKGKIQVNKAEGPVSGPHRLVLHVVSAVYPPDSSGRYTMEYALAFERRITVVAGQRLHWHLQTAQGIAL